MKLKVMVLPEDEDSEATETDCTALAAVLRGLVSRGNMEAGMVHDTRGNEGAEFWVELPD